MDKKLLNKILDKYVEQKLKRYPRRFIDDLKKALSFRIDAKLAKGEKISIKIFDKKAKQQNVNPVYQAQQKEKNKERAL